MVKKKKVKKKQSLKDVKHSKAEELIAGFIWDKHERIEDVVDKAYLIFKTFGWTYAGKEVTREELYTTITDLIRISLSTDSEFVSTGRFVVSADHDNEFEDLTISLNL